VIVLAALAFTVMAYLLGRLTVVFVRAGVEEYQRRYHVETMEELTDFLLVIEPAQARKAGWVLGIFTVISLFLASPILALVSGAVAAWLPSFLVARLRARRVERFEHQLADALTTLSGAMRSGLTFRQGMGEVASLAQAPLGQEFRVFMREMQLGTSIEAALDNLSERVGSQELELFVSAAQIALKVGGNVAEMFDKLASTLRERFRIEGRIRTLTAQGKLQGVVIGAMPIFVWVGFDFFRPDLTRPMMEHWFGLFIVLVILTLEVLGALVIRRIVQIEI
jgi:tight adherence protein B